LDKIAADYEKLYHAEKKAHRVQTDAEREKHSQAVELKARKRAFYEEDNQT